MTCECLPSAVKEHFDAGHPTMTWIATGEPVYMIDPGPPPVTITDIVVGEYFIDICALCEKEITKYAVYFEDAKDLGQGIKMTRWNLRGTAPRPSTTGEFPEDKE